MDMRFDNDWYLQPIKGDTGKAYIGKKADDKVFIKRNTTPMLAALAKEGITPKLIWTKRTGNGDTLSAQEWLEGRILTSEEIGKRNDVIDVLYHLHHSKSLQEILAKVGGKTVTPQKLLTGYFTDLPTELGNNEFLMLVHQYMEKNLPTFKANEKTVVHGDVNYRNWLVCQNYLYLVDWDSIMFADAAYDIGTVLGHYLPVSSWSQWLMSYGVQPDVGMLEKTYWYALLSVLQEAKKQYRRGAIKEANEEILQLKRIYSG
ncbi:phosphotransferase family protein [Enterococcus italicus]|uniref:phosphotransferase family protein n=1 Tax=Enterococcus italicus TaxID=246144 RepID=UPI0020745BBA|nr:phosphotransferase family protein [Enterococcus italicus]